MDIGKFGVRREDIRCERCGAPHTLRQRCPLEDAANALLADVKRQRTAGVAPATTSALPPPAPVFVPQAAAVAPPPPIVWRAGARPRRHPVRTALGWMGAVVSTVALVACLSVAGVYIAVLTQVDQSVPEALIAIFLSLGIGLVFGMALMYVSARVYAKVVFSALATFLVTVGFLMMVIAPVLRQMNTPELAEFQAFNDLLSFGAVSLFAGGALGLLCIRWAAAPRARRTLARWARLLGSAYGVLLGISGVFGIFSLLFLIDARGDIQTSVVERAISLTAVATWSFVPGLILTYQGISASMGEGSGEFRIPIAGWGVALYCTVLLAGGLNMAAVHPIAAPMPSLHVLAAALPGVALIAVAARGTWLRGQPVRWLTWRQLTLAIAISMTVGVTIAAYVESIGSFGAVVLLLAHHGAFADVVSSDDFFNVIGDSKYVLSRNEQFLANLITASLLAPLIEETGKGLGVRFLLRRDTTRAQAFVMGAGAGAGFGFLEAMLYGLAGIQHDHAGNWWAIMLVRGGSTSLHVFNTALVGLAWWYAVNGASPRRAWLLFAVAVLSHAAWNALAVTIDSRIFGLDTLSERTVEIIAYSIIAVVVAVYVAAIPLIARRLRERDRTSPDATTLCAMTPWLGVVVHP